MIANVSELEVNTKSGLTLANFSSIENCSVTPIQSIKKVRTVNSSTLSLPDSSESVKIGGNLNQDQIRELEDILFEFKSAFSLNGKIGWAQYIKHSVELMPEAQPFVEPFRRHPQLHKDEMSRQTTDMLKNGIITPSESPWASEYVVVKKKNGEWRICIDFRKLNSLTVKNAYPLPNLEECLENLGGRLFYSQFDFTSGYWQVEMDQKSRPSTAFRTNGGLFEFVECRSGCRTLR